MFFFNGNFLGLKKGYSEEVALSFFLKLIDFFSFLLIPIAAIALPIAVAYSKS